MQMSDYNVCAGNKPLKYLKHLSAFWRSFCAAGEKSLRFNKTKRERERLEERSNFKDTLASFLHRMPEADGFQSSWDVPPDELRSCNYDVKCTRVNFVGNKLMCQSVFHVLEVHVYLTALNSNFASWMKHCCSNAAGENYGKCSCCTSLSIILHCKKCLIFFSFFPVQTFKQS